MMPPTSTVPPVDVAELRRLATAGEAVAAASRLLEAVGKASSAHGGGALWWALHEAAAHLLVALSAMQREGFKATKGGR